MVTDNPPDPDDVSGQSLGWWGSAAWWPGRQWAGRYWRKVLPPTPVGTAGRPRPPPGWLVQTSGQVRLCSAPAVSLDQSKSNIIHQHLPWGRYHLLGGSWDCIWSEWGTEGVLGVLPPPRSLPRFMVLDLSNINTHIQPLMSETRGVPLTCVVAAFIAAFRNVIGKQLKGNGDIRVKCHIVTGKMFGFLDVCTHMYL